MSLVSFVDKEQEVKELELKALVEAIEAEREFTERTARGLHALALEVLNG